MLKNTKNRRSGSLTKRACSAILFVLIALFLTLSGFIHKSMSATNYGMDEAMMNLNAAAKPEPLATTPTNPKDVRIEKETRRLDNPHQKQHNTYKPVDCPSQIASRNDPNKTYYDPNKGMIESPKRYVNATTPPLWISLHKKQYDRLRWAHIMNKGNYYETGITDQFHQILVPKPPGLVLDIGMNIGWFTIYSRAMGHSVVGLEPNPIMHTRLCESLALNHWEGYREDIGLSPSSFPWVKTFAYGLGDQESILTLNMGNNPGKSSFLEGRVIKGGGSIFVKVIRLDDLAIQEGWMEDSSPPIHLFKMDVEGYEPMVLKGATKLLQSGRIENILMENSNNDPQLLLEAFSQISKAGYRLHLMSDTLGRPFHQELLPKINEALEKGDLESESMKWLSKVECNLWWKRRDDGLKVA